MKLVVIIRQPGRGFYKMYLTGKETLRFSNGKARREPASKDAITNSVPIKYITSIKIIGAGDLQCSVCEQEKEKLICYECIENVAKSSKSPKLEDSPILL